MRIQCSIALLLAGCPLVEEVGEKPDVTATSDLDTDASEGSSSSSSGSSGDADTDEPPVDGPIDCAMLPADAELLGGEPLGALGFPPPCSPRSSGEGEHKCCSDDPAAVGGTLPAYENKGIVGSTPIFSGDNNPIGTWGVCVRTAHVSPGSGLLEPQAENCPIPCNPTWSEDDIAAVCGDRVCCQTQPLEPEDCIFDPDTELWRPVTGDDIGNGTDWSYGLHATHQDPAGVGCEAFAGGEDNDAWYDCVRQLTVADQRGFCLSLPFGESCPHTTEVDACMQINMGLVPPPQ
jgi:hypothetical protein